MLSDYKKQNRILSSEELTVEIFPESPSGRMGKALWLVAERQNRPRNCQANLFFWFSGDSVVPLTQSLGLPGQSWIVSPENHFYDYATEELRWLSQPWRLLAGVALRLVDTLTCWRQLEPAVYINNWLVSTCLAEPDLDVSQLFFDLQRTFPNSPLLFRTLTHRLNFELMKELKDQGAIDIVGRRVVFQDVVRDQLLKRRQVKNDHRLLKRSGYSIEKADSWSDQDWARAGDLYSALYLEKYSLSNPQYDSGFLRASHELGHLEFWGLRSPQGSLDAVIGLYRLGGVQANPVFGYDTSLPKKLGLYSSLTWLSMELASQHEALIHASAGVADFKRNRGGRSEFEYSMVLYRHLSYRQRLSWKAIELISNRVAGPLMQAFDL